MSDIYTTRRLLDPFNNPFAAPATARGVADLEEDPDTAARALELSSATGIPAPVIHEDVEGFERDHKTALVSDMIQNNPRLQEYINSYPMASKLSNDDYPGLIDISAAVKKFAFGGGRPIDKAIEGIQQGWGEEPLGATEENVKKMGEYFGITNPIAQKVFMDQLAVSPIGVPALGFEVMSRAFGAAIHGAAKGGAALLADAGGEALFGRSESALEHDIGGFLEWVTMRGDIGTIKPHMAPEEAARVIGKSEPYLASGETPPPGVDPIFDKIKKQQISDDLSTLRDAQKAVAASKTVERSPDAGEFYLRQEIGDRQIGLSSDAVRALYGDKVPLPDDGLLGWVPDLEAQMKLAETTGGDVKVPLAGWLAHMDPAVAKELEEHLRLRPEGMTKFETQLEEPRPPEGEAQPLSPREPASVEDLARREGSYEPLAQVGDRGIRLERQPEPIDIYGDGEVLADDFKISDNGQDVGNVYIRRNPKNPTQLVIEDMDAYKAGGPQALGLHGMRQLFDAIKTQYPDAKSIGGYRVTGARAKATEAQGRDRLGWAEIPLKDPKAFAQFLDDITGWTSVETSVPREPVAAGTIREPVTERVTAEWRPAETYTKNEAQLADAVQQVIQQMAPKVAAAVVDRTEIAGRQVGGVFLPGTTALRDLILVSMRPEARVATIGTAFHETIHHLRSGFFTADEWSTLERAAERNGWVEKHRIEHRYEEVPDWLKTEEAIAEEFRLWGQGKLTLGEALPKDAAAIFQRLKEFLASVAEAVRRVVGGQVGVERLFQKVAGGEIGAREPTEVGRDRFAPAFAMATEMEEKALFAKAASIGMTEVQFKRFMGLIDKQREENEARAQRRADRASEVTKTEQWKANEPKVREEVTERINQRPDIMADDFFGRGMFNGEKVRRQRIGEEFLTAEQKAGLDPSVYGPKGVDPLNVAGVFGYFSAEDMISSLTALHAARKEADLAPAGYKSRLIREKTQAEMMKRYGVPEHDALLKEAREDIVTDTLMDMLHEETFALAAKAGVEPPMTKAAMAAAVKQRFAEQPVGLVKDPKRFFMEAGKAGREAAVALSKGDALEAFRQLQRQTWATHYAREAMTLAKELDRHEKFTKRFAARQVTGISQEYTNQIHGIMQRINAPIKRSVQDLSNSLEGTSLESFVGSKLGDLREMPVADFLFDQNEVNGQNFRKSVKDMSVYEFRAVDSSLRTMAHNGRNEFVVEKAGERADFEAVRDRMIQQLEGFKANDLPPLEGKGKSILGLPKGGVPKLFRTIVAAHLQMENLFNRWDRWDPQGDFQQWIMRPLAEGSNTLAATERKYSKMLAELRDDTNLNEPVHNPLFRDALSKSIDNPSGDLFSMTRRNFREVLSNVGNASNLKKLAEGYSIPQEAIMTWVHATATRADWDYASKLGKIFAEIKEESDRMYRRLSGLEPESIELTPIETPFGTYDGWYHPVMHDRLREGPSKTLMGRDPLQEPEYFRATTPAGYTKSRTGYVAPLSLEQDMVVARMKQMINDIAMREAVINTGKFFYDKDFRAAVAKHSFLGVEVRDGLIPYLRDVANVANIDSGAWVTLSAWSEWARQNVITTLIGLNPQTVIKHGTTALIQSAQEVGVANFAREFAMLANRLPSGESNWGFAMKTSEELQRRHRHFQETLGGGYQEAFQEPSLRALVHQAGAWPVATSDLLSAVPTWLAKYRERMEAGDSQGDAIYDADRSVRRAHGSTAQTNRSAIMRGNALGQWFTSVYGFFNHIANRQLELGWRAQDTWDKMKGGNIAGAAESAGQAGKILISDATKVLLPGLLAYYILPALIEEIASPLPEGKHEGWASWAAKALLKTASASWIPTRDIMAGLLASREPSMGLLGVGGKAAFETTRDIMKIATTGDPNKVGKLLKDSTMVIGALTGLVNAQVGRTSQFVYNYFRGKDKPKDFWQVLRGLSRGESQPPKHR